ncbi:odorant receptor 131-2-like [Brachyhypopomus gauderio]|uniref:odorant receptor 131-2-like n=1 Tax=Brachyhypopomus gauderio TaxID=698409 RepID=UPI004041F593
MNSSMNQMRIQDTFEEAFSKNFIIVFFGFIIICINGTFVFTFMKSSVFHSDPRYILYIHLVINDMLMLFVSVTLCVISYACKSVDLSLCCMLLLIVSTTHKNTPLNLAGMAVERYIAVCKPLHHPQICTVPRTCILICLIWGIGVIPGLTDLLIAAITRTLSVSNTVTVCTPTLLYNTVYHEEKNIAMQCIYMAAVWLVLIYTYYRVLVAAKKMTIDKVSAKKAQNTILLHGGQLLFCMLSYTTPVLDIVLVLIFPVYRTKITFFNYLLTSILPRLLTPLIYGVRDQKLIQHMKRHILCKNIVKVESVKQ